MLIFAAAAITLFLILEIFSLIKPLRNVEYEMRVESPLVEVGDEVVLHTSVTNYGRLPLGFIKVTELLPSGAKLSDGVLRGRLTIYDVLNPEVESTHYLMPQQRLNRRIRVRFQKRGRYVFLRSRIFGGDFLGLSSKTETYQYYKEVVIAPKPYESVDLTKALGGFMGEICVRRFIMEDPILTLGFHEYTGREPMRSISWTRTAQQGDMMVKVFDHTIEANAAVLLNVECVDRFKPQEELVESCLSIARTVCEELEKNGVKYTVSSNANTAGAPDFWKELGEGTGAGHMNAVLEGLGRSLIVTKQRFSVTLRGAMATAAMKHSHILITPQITDELTNGAARLAARSGGPVLVITGDGEVRVCG